MKNKLITGALCTIVLLAFCVVGCQNETISNGTPGIGQTTSNGKIISLQAVVDDAKAGATIDCSQYNITDYNATVSKSLTIKNANMQGDSLKVISGGVVLENVSKAAVNTNSSLKISGSSLSSLTIGDVTNSRGELLYSVGGGRGDSAVVVELEGATVVKSADLDLAGAGIVTDAAADIEYIEVKKSGAIQGNADNIRIAGSKIKLEVTNLSADNVTFVGNNTTLDVMNRQSSIKNVETDEDVICQLEMEEGLYANMENPTVRGENGKLTRVDNTNESILSKITLELANLEKVAYSVGEVVNLNGLEIFDTYNRDGVVEFTQEFPEGVKVPTHTRRETAPLDNPEYSFSINGANAVGYTFQESDRGQVDITITKTEGNISVSTVLKVTVLKDDELAISYVGAEAEQLADLPKVFKKSQNVVIPTNMTKDGFVFAGWYEDNNKGPITGWQANTKEGSVSLYARWINMLYVDPDVTDDMGTGAYNKPFKMIEQAVAAITSTGSYTIVPMKDIDKVGYMYLTKDFPVKITIQPEIGTVSIGDGSKYEYDPEYYNEYESVIFAENTELTMRNITLYSQIDALQGKSLTLENVTVRNKIRCGQALFTNVTSGDVTSAAATFTDVTIDGYFNGTDISFNNVFVTKGADFEEGSLTQVRINGNVTCDSAVFSNAELGQMTCNGDATFKNVSLTAEDRSLIANGDINLGGELSFAGKINLAAGKKIILTDRIATDNPIVLALTSAEQKDQIIDGRSDYVSADSNKFIIDGTAWYLKNGQLRRYWYVDGESGDDNNLGSEDHPLKTVHKAVESAAAESIIYVGTNTSEDACMDIKYDVEIYPWGYVEGEPWNGGYAMIQRNCFGDDYRRSFIKVNGNIKLKARYIEFNGNGRFVVVPMSHAAGITVAGGDIDIKHCIISRFSSSPFDDDDVVGCGGPGGLSVYNNNETEKTIILEDITIDSCHGYTMALAVGNFGYDDGHLTVEIGNNVNITGGKFEITESLRPETDYLPAVIRLDGLYSKLTLTKDIKLNTYFEDGNINYKNNHLIDISAGVFTIDNCTLTLPEKPAINNTNIIVNGIYIHKMRTEYPKFYYKGNAAIESYDDVALKMEGHFTRLEFGSSNSDTFHIVSKSIDNKGTGLEAVGVYPTYIADLYIFGFDTGVRYLESEEFSGEYDPHLKKIENCNVAIEVGKGSKSGNVKIGNFAIGYTNSKLVNNTYDVKFYNTDRNKLTLGGTDIRTMLFDCKNTNVMNGVINIASIPEKKITLDLTNDPNGDIENVFTITKEGLTVEEVLAKFTVGTTGYSLQQGSDANHISIKKN